MKLLACFGGCLILSGRFLSAQEPGKSFGPAAVPEESCSPFFTPMLTEQPFCDTLPTDAAETAQPVFPRYPPSMFGDLLDMESVRQYAGNRLDAFAPAGLRGAFKIADNESPRPLDRVFITSNDFSAVNRLFLAANASSASVYREMIGFEKKFLKGDASIGMRLP
jgi:hypothetical protein